MTTALAAEALSGLLSLRASVTLASFLTAILLPWALVKARRSASLATMTLVMLVLLWRGEAWKTVCLQSEQRVSLEGQPRRRISSNKGWSSPGSLTPRAGDHFASRERVIVFRPVKGLSDPTLQQTLSDGHSTPAICPRNNDDRLLGHHLADHEPSPVPCRALCGQSHSSLPQGLFRLRTFKLPPPK